MVSLLSLMEGLSLVIKQLPQKALPALGPVAQLVPPNPLRVRQEPLLCLNGSLGLGPGGWKAQIPSSRGW